jgi:glycosyltransferase involved in cell wall biosynthesis
VRVLFLSHYALPHVGGIEVVVDALGRELAGRGHEVVHVASAAVRQDEVDAGDPDPSIRVVRVPALNTAEERLGVPWPLFSPKLLGVLRREVPQADVVHAHGLLYMSSALGLLLARRVGRSQARVVTEHVGHVEYDSALVDRVERVALGTVGRATGRAAQAAIALYAKVEAELRELLPGREVHVIPNGVDVER